MAICIWVCNLCRFHTKLRSMAHKIKISRHCEILRKYYRGNSTPQIHYDSLPKSNKFSNFTNISHPKYNILLEIVEFCQKFNDFKSTFKGLIMKILAIIVAFCAFAFAEVTQNQPNPTTQATPNPTQPIAQPMAMPYPNPNIQQNIIAQIQQMYPGAFITDMDYEGWGYEVEINDHLDLFFDNNGKFLGQKWD